METGVTESQRAELLFPIPQSLLMSRQGSGMQNTRAS